MIGADDLDVFYSVEGFGTPCACRREGEDDVPFVAILGAVDEIALEGYAVTAEHSLRYPTADVDLDEGDLVLVDVQTDEAGVPLIVDGQAQDGTLYRVRTEPRRLNDGRETGALLSSVPT